MNVDFKGYGENVATFITDNTVQAGTVVKMKENYTVTACESGDEILGVCINTREGFGAIQTAGYIELPATQEIPVGIQKIHAGSGTAAAPGGTTDYKVLYSGENTVGFIL